MSQPCSIPLDIPQCDAQTLLNSTRPKLDAIQAEIDALCVRRDTLSSRLHELAWLVSPIYRLPAETLSHIFLFCVDETAPWYLTWVDKNWRGAARSTTALWAQFNMPSAHLVAHQERITEQLRLSGSVRLLDVNASTIREVQALVPHSDRWRSLRIVSPAPCRPESLPVKGKLAALKRLELVHVQCDYDNVSSYDLDTFLSAPQLRIVFLTDSILSATSPSLRFTWRQLTHFRARLPVQHLFAILREAQNLVQCGIDNCDPWRNGDGRVTVLRMPELRFLTVARPEFLVFLDAPALEYLHSRGSIPPVRDFLEGRAHTTARRLHTLVLNDIPPYSEAVAPFLRQPYVADLNSLVLFTGRGADTVKPGLTEVYRLLSRDTQQEHVLQKLRFLAVGGADNLNPFQAEDGLFVSMLHSWIAESSPPKIRLRLFSCDSSYAAYDFQIASGPYRDAGLDIKYIGNRQRRNVVRRGSIAPVLKEIGDDRLNELIDE